ncbi:MAG: pantetheine-phosphate adenylyltransferase [Omnitrophica bacterium RIFCSPHIGHO2_02_FULL_63_14]|nr:MAG: pantetheine-phosphate adenylyltransferase [Omnitrophica bacterium RIFCSPHIGHO2_02_FULL_63_14]
MQPKRARGVFPGTFDPVTYGHIDLIRRALEVFDEVIVAVAAESPDKRAFFSCEERIGFIRTAVKGLERVRVERFDGLVVDFARARKAFAMIRGIRLLSDFEYEFQMALMNRKLARDIETVFLMPHESTAYVSSRLVKEIARFGGDARAFVPGFVWKALKAKYGGAG